MAADGRDKRHVKHDQSIRLVTTAPWRLGWGARGEPTRSTGHSWQDVPAEGLSQKGAQGVS